MTTVRTYQQQSLSLLADILAQLQAQSSQLAQLATMPAHLAAIRTSIERIEQFIAPTGVAAPVATDQGMALDLRRLKMAIGGSGDNDPDNSVWELLNIVQGHTGAGLLAVQRIRNAIWPDGQVAPGDSLDGPDSLYHYLYRVALATAAPLNSIPRMPLQVATEEALDALAGIGEDAAWIVEALGGRVAGLSAIDYLSRIATCSCGDDAPPPAAGGCVQPTVSAGVAAAGGRTWATWVANSPAFLLGALAITSHPAAPSSGALVSDIWPELSIFVASNRAAYWDDGGETGRLYPTNEWLQVPVGAGDALAVNVGAGQDVRVYLCDLLSQPEPPTPEYTALDSDAGAILTPEGTAYEPRPYGWAINTWSRIGLTSRLRNTESGFTHQMDPGSYVDLPVLYTVYANVAVNMYQGAGGFVSTLDANQLHPVGPGTNFSFARDEGPFTLYIKVGPPGA